MKLLYIGNLRLPTEKAHGLQIMQNCEAFADAGADVSLWAARRINTPALRDIRDVWAHYGVRRNFALRRLPCLDLMSLTPNRSDAPAKLVFLLQQWSFTLATLIAAIFTRADVYYGRDESVLLALSLIRPRRALAYEAHSRSSGRMGRWLQRQAVRRAGRVFATTRRLADDLIALGAEAARVHVAHDGVRAERFTDLPDQATARAQVGWPDDAFIVGYVGRLQTMAMDKGVGLLVDALAQVDGAALALVGGPDEIAEVLRAQWLARGLPPERFLYAGQVPPAQVPLYLRAFDVCAMPFPWTEHFAYYASPIKLFEYMAAGRPVVASDLPSTAEVVRDGESALLYPPGDREALAAAIARLRDDAALRDQLAARARALVMTEYTWAARARHIMSAITGGPDED
jgi:glycosyltransferase involved in cell wall biosynthesis